MANRFFTPNAQFIGNDGLPIAGGFLYFYATGTDTPLDTYSDADLTIANTNPIELDSDGYAGNVFLQDLAYKVVLTYPDPDPSQIWTFDPVYSSDYSTYAQFRVWNGNPNGAVAGTAGTQGSLPGSSVIWDYQNNILYVCTVTGDAANAVWTAVNQTAATSITVQPQGYLTLASDPQNPVLTGDAVSSTSVFYTPYVGSLVPVYNGTTMQNLTFSQLTLSLTSGQQANTIYDVFVFNNSGVLTLATGPAWANSTAGSGSRGTGGGSSQIQRLNGMWVNQVQITGRNGSNTYTIPANNATYLGSIFIDSVAGQVSCYLSYGQSRKWGVWNAYNRVPVYLKAGDPNNWTLPNSATTYRAANTSTANSLTVFSGLAEEDYAIRYNITYFNSAFPSGNGFSVTAAIGYNSITAASGMIGVASFINNTTGTVGYTTECTCIYLVSPSLGINTVTALEKSSSSMGIIGTGSESGMLLSAQWRA